MTKRWLSSLFLGAALSATTAAHAEIKIGVIGPLTGPNAAVGLQLKNGAEQAAEDINEKGGINGEKIKLVFGDDASQPAQGVSVANTFVGEGIKFVLGAYNTGVTMPSSEVFAENGILQVTPASTGVNVTERKMWNIFRTCGRDDQQGSVAGKYVVDKLKGKKIAIVHDKTPYGKGLADETKKAMNGAGVTEILYDGINVGEKDFSALVSKLKSLSADVVYFGGYYTEGGLLVRQMKDQGLSTVLMGGDGIAEDEFAQVAGPGAEGTLMTFVPDPTKRPEAKATFAKFDARKYKPAGYTLYTYAALQIVAQAATATKSLDPKVVAAEMHKGGAFKTVIGDIAFDAKGDITRPDYVMYTWKKNAEGKITYVEQ